MYHINNSINVNRIFSFLWVGLLNTTVGYFLFASLIFLGINYTVALFLATIGGAAFNFFSFGKMVFYSRQSIVVFAKFVAGYTLVYLMNICMLWILSKYIVSIYVCQIICVPFNISLSWYIMSYWVYKRN